MKWVKYLSVGLVLLLLDSVLGRYLEIGSHSPDFLLLFLIVISLKEGRIKGTIAGFIIGMTQDVYLATGFVGVSAFAKSVVGFLAGYFSTSRRSRKMPGVLIPISVSIGIYYFIKVLFYTAGTEDGVIGAILSKGLPSAVYSMVFGVLMVFIVSMASEGDA